MASTCELRIESFPISFGITAFCFPLYSRLTSLFTSGGEIVPPDVECDGDVVREAKCRDCPPVADIRLTHMDYQVYRGRPSRGRVS